MEVTSEPVPSTTTTRSFSNTILIGDSLSNRSDHYLNTSRASTYLLLTQHTPPSAAKTDRNNDPPELNAIDESSDSDSECIGDVVPSGLENKEFGIWIASWPRELRERERDKKRRAGTASNKSARSTPRKRKSASPLKKRKTASPKQTAALKPQSAVQSPSKPGMPAVESSKDANVGTKRSAEELLTPFETPKRQKTAAGGSPPTRSTSMSPALSSHLSTFPTPASSQTSRRLIFLPVDNGNLSTTPNQYGLYKRPGDQLAIALMACARYKEREIEPLTEPVVSGLREEASRNHGLGLAKEEEDNKLREQRCNEWNQKQRELEREEEEAEQLAEKLEGEMVAEEKRSLRSRGGRQGKGV